MNATSIIAEYHNTKVGWRDWPHGYDPALQPAQLIPGTPWSTWIPGLGVVPSYPPRQAMRDDNRPLHKRHVDLTEWE